jgi:hypothetical protein
MADHWPWEQRREIPDEYAPACESRPGRPPASAEPVGLTD